MIKHTLEISQRPARISLRHRQLMLKFQEDGQENCRTFACEDIGVLILQHPAISLSSAALAELLNCGAVVVICNEKHLPAGMLLPTITHTELVPRMMSQLDAPLPARKQAWKAIVQAKVRAQAAELATPNRIQLEALAGRVQSGDSSNIEAQAARLYWPVMFPDRYAKEDRRDPASESYFNVMLNYGYAIIRAAVARAVVGAGLQPALGVFHRRRNNPYCLADDLMEPLRPLVDRKVKEILLSLVEEDYPPVGSGPLREHRRELLGILAQDVVQDGQKGPLQATLPRYVAGFHRLLTREGTSIHPPVG